MNALSTLSRLRSGAADPRQRGFGLLEISLGIVVGLGLLIGGIVYFQQVSVGAEVTEKTRAAVALSSETRAQFRTSAAFSTTDPATLDEDLTDLVIGNTSFPASITNGVSIFGNGQTFDLEFTGLKETVCNRMASSPGNLDAEEADVDTTNCATGTLVITYGR
jgi:hypothetical protein